MNAFHRRPPVLKLRRRARALRKVWPYALLVFAITLVAGHAKVFLRWGAGPYAHEILAARGGRTAYQSDITINGVPADLSVIAFKEPLHAVLHRLQHRLADSSTRYAAGSMAHARLRPEHGGARLLLLSTPFPSRTLVFAVTGDTRGAGPRLAHAYRHFPVPPYPGAVPAFTFSDAAARTAVASAATPDSSHTVQAFFRTRLVAEGWTLAPLPSMPLTSTGFYLRGDDLCCVTTEARPPGNDTLITVLHKRQELK